MEVVGDWNMGISWNIYKGRSININVGRSIWEDLWELSKESMGI